MTLKKTAISAVALVLTAKLLGTLFSSEDVRAEEPKKEPQPPVAYASFQDGVCAFNDYKSVSGAVFVLLYELEGEYLTAFARPIGGTGPHGPFKPERPQALFFFHSDSERLRTFRAQGYLESSGMISATLNMKLGTLLPLLKNPYAIGLNFMSVDSGKRQDFNIDLEDLDLKAAFEGFRACVSNGGA